MLLNDLGKYGKKKYYIMEGCEIYIAKDNDVFIDTIKLFNDTDFFSFMVKIDMDNYADKICENCNEEIWNKYKNFEILTMFTKQTEKNNFKSIIILKQ